MLLMMIQTDYLIQEQIKNINFSDESEIKSIVFNNPMIIKTSEDGDTLTVGKHNKDSYTLNILCCGNETSMNFNEQEFEGFINALKFLQKGN